MAGKDQYTLEIETFKIVDNWLGETGLPIIEAGEAITSVLSVILYAVRTGEKELIKQHAGKQIS